TAPLPSVVRLSVGSWMTTRWPSRDLRTSNSKPRRRRRQAEKLERVFSGAWRSRPRWPTIAGPSAGSSRSIRSMGGPLRLGAFHDFEFATAGEGESRRAGAAEADGAEDQIAGLELVDAVVVAALGRADAGELILARAGGLVEGNGVGDRRHA